MAASARVHTNNAVIRNRKVQKVFSTGDQIRMRKCEIDTPCSQGLRGGRGAKTSFISRADQGSGDSAEHS